MLRKFIQANVWLSRHFDRAFLPRHYYLDGNTDFVREFCEKWLVPHVRVVDIGGGKNPFLGLQRKRDLNAYVIGVDIDQHELDAAPLGSYDAKICVDIAKAQGDGDADVCICQAVLEHVPNVEQALRAISTFLRPGGVALIFVPSRNALFARLNLLLPENFKRQILFTVFPHSRRSQGFKSYYDRCTPRDFEKFANSMGLEIVEARYYFVSSYFSFFAPLYIAWRLWVLGFKFLFGRQAAETFSMALKSAEDSAASRR